MKLSDKTNRLGETTDQVQMDVGATIAVLEKGLEESAARVQVLHAKIGDGAGDDDNRGSTIWSAISSLTRNRDGIVKKFEANEKRMHQLESLSFDSDSSSSSS